MFKILDGRKHFFQWDLNQKLLVEDASVVEVHFCTRACNEALVVEVKEVDGARIAEVPNILLQKAFDLKAYAYTGEEYTKHCEIFEVVSRTKPTDYIYSETEVKKLETLENEIEKLKLSNAYKEHTTKEVFLQKKYITNYDGELGLIFANTYTVETYNSNGELIDTYEYQVETDWNYNSGTNILYISVPVGEEEYVEYVIYDGARRVNILADYGDYHCVENLYECEEEFTLKIIGDFVSTVPNTSLHLVDEVIDKCPYLITSNGVNREISSLDKSLKSYVDTKVSQQETYKQLSSYTTEVEVGYITQKNTKILKKIYIELVIPARDYDIEIGLNGYKNTSGSSSSTIIDRDYTNKLIIPASSKTTHTKLEMKFEPEGYTLAAQLEVGNYAMWKQFSSNTGFYGFHLSTIGSNFPIGTKVTIKGVEK